MTPLRHTFSLNFRQRKIKLGQRTLIMGILNVTPDSFSDGGLFLDKKQAVARAQEMLTEGADIIDIGGESTRPGSLPVSASQEIQRVVPVIEALRKLHLTRLISIDTNKALVAQAGLKAGADWVNSLGGFGFDAKLVEVVKKFGCPIVIYHIKGIPKSMQQGEIRYKDVVKEISTFFTQQIDLALSNGISKTNIVLDPGIGFGKTLTHNLEIIRRFGEFKHLGQPLMIGVSRKSHLGLLLKTELALKVLPGPLERLEASLAETAVAVLSGAHIVRTHDVKETKKFLAVLDSLF